MTTGLADVKRNDRDDKGLIESVLQSNGDDEDTSSDQHRTRQRAPDLKKDKQARDLVRGRLVATA